MFDLTKDLDQGIIEFQIWVRIEVWFYHSIFHDKREKGETEWLLTR